MKHTILLILAVLIFILVSFGQRKTEFTKDQESFFLTIKFFSEANELASEIMKEFIGKEIATIC